MDVQPELVRAVQRGEPGAMDDLIRATYTDVYAMCRRLLRDETDAADATQEVFLRVTRSVRGFRAESSFGTWLHRVTANVCATMLRKRGDTRAQGRSASWKAFAAPDSDDSLVAADDVQGRVEASDHAARIARAINVLPESDREVIILRDVEGLSTKDTARALGIKEGAVKVRLHRAHAKLREAVGE